MSASPKPQTLANHRRFFPMYHYLTGPLLFAYFIYTVVGWVRDFGWHTTMTVVLALALWGIYFGARVMALTVQNRLIRLEEELRMARLLPPELAARTGEIGVSQRVGLRFASDDEVPELVERILSGELRERREIKAAIRTWRPDYLRV